MLKSFFVNGPDRFFKVSIYFRVFEVDFFGLEISQYPREDGILRKVTKGSITGLIQVHEIFIV